MPLLWRVVLFTNILIAPLICHGNSKNAYKAYKVKFMFVAGIDAPPRKKQALPRPVKIDKTQGAQKRLASKFSGSTSYLPNMATLRAPLAEKLIFWPISIDFMYSFKPF